MPAQLTLHTLILYLIIAGCSLLAIGLTALIIYLFTIRKYVLTPKPGNRLAVHRQWGGFAFKVLTSQGRKYLYDETCQGWINGKKALFVDPKSPSAFVWPFSKKKIEVKDKAKSWPAYEERVEWKYLSWEAILAIINDKHVKVVANAGKSDLETADILMLCLMGIVIIMVFMIMAKEFGWLKSPPVECAINMTKLAAASKGIVI